MHLGMSNLNMNSIHSYLGLHGFKSQNSIRAHFLAAPRYRFSDYFADVIRFGYDLRLDEYIEWRDALEALTLTTKDNALYPLLHFVLDDLPTKSRGCTLVCIDTYISLFVPFVYGVFSSF